MKKTKQQTESPAQASLPEVPSPAQIMIFGSLTSP